MLTLNIVEARGFRPPIIVDLGPRPVDEDLANKI